MGLAYPFKNSITGVLGNKSESDAIRTSIQNILTTPKGSVVYNPKFGSILPSLVFEPINDATICRIAHYAAADLEVQEPRIKVNYTDIRQDGNKIIIHVGFFEVKDNLMEQKLTPVTFTRS